MPRFAILLTLATLTLAGGCSTTPFGAADTQLTTGSINSSVPVDDEDDHIWLDDCPECEFDETVTGDLPEA